MGHWGLVEQNDDIPVRVLPSIASGAGTIEDNLRMSDISASEGDIEKALEVSQSAEFVSQKEIDEGYAAIQEAIRRLEKNGEDENG